MQNAVNRRGIQYLWHFTRIENLAAILRDGIIPRSQLESRQIPVEFNDPYRLDGHRDASCFSIYHPNYKMFYSLRRQYPETRWAVIGCNASVLWLKRCAFCHENAASNNVTQTPLAARVGVDAFERIFLPVDGKPSRQELQLPDACPTNPQAEVLVFDVVEPALIIGAVCQDSTTASALSIEHPNFRIIYHRAHFSPRGDYQHWRQSGQ